MNKVKYLLTYRYSLIAHNLTIEFTQAYLMGRLSTLRDLSHLKLRPDYRQADQMNQAARSGKQNIVEGVAQGVTSKTGEIKLLGVARASLEELQEDYEDFLRQHGFLIYPKENSKVTAFRKKAYLLSHLSNLSPLGEFVERPSLCGNPQDDANFLLTLCHQASYLLDRQIKSLEEKFVRTGGLAEELHTKRRKYRGY